MNNKIVAFVKRMEEQDRTLEVNGNFVVISPAAGLAISDMMEMQALNKKGELAKYVTQLRQDANTAELEAAGIITKVGE